MKKLTPQQLANRSLTAVLGLRTYLEDIVILDYMEQESYEYVCFTISYRKDVEYRVVKEKIPDNGYNYIVAIKYGNKRPLTISRRF